MEGLYRYTVFEKLFLRQSVYFIYHSSDGQYEEERDVLSGGVRFQVTGKWTFKDSTLIMLDDAKYGYSSSPHNYNIQFVEKNLFYARSLDTMEMPGQIIYVYFRRLD